MVDSNLLHPLHSNHGLYLLLAQLCHYAELSLQEPFGRSDPSIRPANGIPHLQILLILWVPPMVQDLRLLLVYLDLVPSM